MESFQRTATRILLPDILYDDELLMVVFLVCVKGIKRNFYANHIIQFSEASYVVIAKFPQVAGQEAGASLAILYFALWR